MNDEHVVVGAVGDTRGVGSEKVVETSEPVTADYDQIDTDAIGFGYDQPPGRAASTNRDVDVDTDHVHGGRDQRGARPPKEDLFEVVALAMGGGGEFGRDVDDLEEVGLRAKRPRELGRDAQHRRCTGRIVKRDEHRADHAGRLCTAHAPRRFRENALLSYIRCGSFPDPREFLLVPRAPALVGLRAAALYDRTDHPACMTTPGLA